jgi:arylsulfatase A-like enzyme
MSNLKRAIKHFGLVAMLGGMCSLGAAGGRPNIVVLLVDDLGWNDLSSHLVNAGHGSSYHRTPNIDGLAAAGMSFTAGYTSPNCMPSRAALLSGQYAPRTQIYAVNNLDRGDPEALIRPPTQSRELDARRPTIGTILQQAGYITAHFGKWHVGSNFQEIERRGFDYSYSQDGAEFPAGTNISYMAIEDAGEWKFNRFGPRMHQFAKPYTADYIQQQLLPHANGNDPMSLVGSPKHLTDAMGDATGDFLHNRRPLHGKDQPFFLYVCFNIPHTPIEPRPDLVAKYAGIASTDPRHANPEYAAFVEHMDQAVARLLDQLAKLGEDTLILLLSDNGVLPINGPKHNQPLRGFKGMHYEGGIRVPWIVHWPGKIQPGSASAEPVHVVDIFPTLIEIAGASPPAPGIHPLDGESFVSLLTGSKTRLNRDALFAHFPGYLGFPFIRSVPLSFINKRVGNDRYKLYHFHETQRYEMYNLTQDLGESNNLIVPTRTEAVQTIAQDLRADLVQWLDHMNPRPMSVRKTGEPVPPPVALPEPTPGNGR